MSALLDAFVRLGLTPDGEWFAQLALASLFSVLHCEDTSGEADLHDNSAAGGRELPLLILSLLGRSAAGPGSSVAAAGFWLQPGRSPLEFLANLSSPAGAGQLVRGLADACMRQLVPHAADLPLDQYIALVGDLAGVCALLGATPADLASQAAVGMPSTHVPAHKSASYGASGGRPASGQLGVALQPNESQPTRQSAASDLGAKLLARGRVLARSFSPRQAVQVLTHLFSLADLAAFGAAAVQRAPWVQACLRRISKCGAGGWSASAIVDAYCLIAAADMPVSNETASQRAAVAGRLAEPMQSSSCLPAASEAVPPSEAAVLGYSGDGVAVGMPFQRPDATAATGAAVRQSSSAPNGVARSPVSQSSARWLELVYHATDAGSQRLSPGQFVRLMVTLAKAQQRPPAAWLRRMLLVADAHAGLYTADQLVHVVWAACKMEFRPSQRFCQRCLLSACSAGFVSSPATAGLASGVDSATTDTAADAAEQAVDAHVGEASTPVAGDSAAAATPRTDALTSGRSLTQAVRAATLQSAEWRLAPSTLAKLVWALGFARYEPPRAWVASAIEALQPQLPAMPAADIVDTAVGALFLRQQQPDGWLAAALAAVNAQLDSVSDDTYRRVAWALAQHEFVVSRRALQTFCTHPSARQALQPLTDLPPEVMHNHNGGEPPAQEQEQQQQQQQLRQSLLRLQQQQEQLPTDNSATGGSAAPVPWLVCIQALDTQLQVGMLKVLPALHKHVVRPSAGAKPPEGQLSANTALPAATLDSAAGVLEPQPAKSVTSQSAVTNSQPPPGVSTLQQQLTNRLAAKLFGLYGSSAAAFPSGSGEASSHVRAGAPAPSPTAGTNTMVVEGLHGSFRALPIGEAASHHRSASHGVEGCNEGQQPAEEENSAAPSNQGRNLPALLQTALSLKLLHSLHLENSAAGSSGRRQGDAAEEGLVAAGSSASTSAPQ